MIFFLKMHSTKHQIFTGSGFWRNLLLPLLLFGATMGQLQGISSDTIVYRGNLTVDGQPFNGTAFFKFTLLDDEGRTLWGNSPMDSAGTPLQGVEVAVANGIYTASLGSTADGMAALPEIVVEAFPKLNLRIWFDDGREGFQKIETEQNLAEAPKQIVVSEKKEPPPPKGSRGTRFQFSEPIRFSMGSPQAQIVLVEYSDYECGHCKLFHEVTFPKIKKEYIDTGLLYFLSGNYPLRNHRHSQKAAEASYCAGEQGQYWGMRDLLFENNLALGSNTYISLAGKLGLDLARFQACLDNNLYTTEIQREKLRAKSFGIRQTPSFLLGHFQEETAVEGELLTGSRYWTEFKKQINKLLTQP